jgi:hypothetical protein
MKAIPAQVYTCAETSPSTSRIAHAARLLLRSGRTGRPQKPPLSAEAVRNDARPFISAPLRYAAFWVARPITSQ